MNKKIFDLEEEVKRLKQMNSRNSTAIIIVGLSIVLHALIQML